MKRFVNLNKILFLFGRRSNKTEQYLIRCAKAGDRDAFSRLYSRYVDSIYSFIFSRVSESMVAEDLTSQVFLKAWENIGKFQELGIPFRAWLFRIARNTIIDHYRTRKAHICLDVMPANRPDPEGDVEGQLELHFEEEALSAAMEQLTDEQRQAICLKFLEGLSNREVAHKMGKRAGAIRALQMRGLKTLAKNLMKSEGKVS